MGGVVPLVFAAGLVAASLAGAPNADAQCVEGSRYYDDAAGIHYACLGGVYEAIGDVRGSVPDPRGSPAPGPFIPGDGTFLVGVDIAAGTYRSAPSRDLPCQWWTQSELGNDGSQTGFDSSDGQTYATIRATDEAFHTQFCQPWVKVK